MKLTTHRWPLVAALALLLVASASALFTAAPRAHAAAFGPLSVSGNHLIAQGSPIQLRGVNRSGTEYACIQGWGIFDGPSDAASVQAIAAWGANEVRVPLNEDCWLGLPGVNASFGGANYQAAIAAYVQLLNANGLYAELTDMWSGSNSPQITDAAHAPAFWQSVANAYKGNPLVLFGLMNEPHGVTAACWLNGGSSCNGQVSFAAVGAQSLVNTIRATGATNVIAQQCVDYANDCSGWLANHATDSTGQLIAEFHEYGNNTCANQACWNSGILAVAASFPVLTGELGETYDASSCGGSFISSYMTMADAHGISYSAWVWDTWGTCEQLISNYNGTASGTGITYRAHLLALAGAPTSTPGATNTPTHAPTLTPTRVPTSVPTMTVTPPATHTPSPTPSPTPPPSGGSLSLIQANTQLIDYSGVNESYSAFGAMVHGGDLLVAQVAIAGGNGYRVDHIEDDLGNVWTRVVSGVNGDNTATDIWYANGQFSGPDEVDAYLACVSECRSQFAQTLMTVSEWSGAATGASGHAAASGLKAHSSGNVACHSGDLVVGMYADAGYMRHDTIADGKLALGGKLDNYDAINGLQSYGYATGSTASASFASSGNAYAEVAAACFTGGGGGSPAPTPTRLPA